MLPSLSPAKIRGVVLAAPWWPWLGGDRSPCWEGPGQHPQLMLVHLEALAGMLKESQGHPPASSLPLVSCLLMGHTLPQPHSSPYPHPGSNGTDLSSPIAPRAPCSLVMAVTSGMTTERHFSLQNEMESIITPSCGLG